MSHAAFLGGPKPHLNVGLNSEFLQTVIKLCKRRGFQLKTDPEVLVLNMSSKSLIHHLKLKVLILRKAQILFLFFSS